MLSDKKTGKNIDTKKTILFIAEAVTLAHFGRMMTLAILHNTESLWLLTPVIYISNNPSLSNLSPFGPFPAHSLVSLWHRARLFSIQKPSPAMLKTIYSYSQQ